MSTKPKNKKTRTDDIETSNDGNTKGAERTKQSKSVDIAQHEIQTTGDYAALMSALITDVVKGDITPTILNAAVNAGRQLVKITELNLKYNLNKPKDLNMISGKAQ
jgi:hypothetical protein